MHRRKAYEWLITVDNTLGVMCNLSLDDFVVDEAQPVSSWKTLCLSVDQGSDGWAAKNFLRSRKVCHCVLMDDSHRKWNNGLAALKDPCERANQGAGE